MSDDYSTPFYPEIGSDGSSEESVTAPSQPVPAPTIAGPSQQNPAPLPEPEHSFILTMKPASHFKLALEALANPEFNDFSLGTIHVDEGGFEIMVRNKSDALARLCFKNTPTVDFKFFQPFIGFSIVLPRIPPQFPDDDEVSVYHETKSNQLWFKFETRSFEVRFRRMENFSARFPSVRGFCDAIVPSQDLRDMVDYLLHLPEEEASSAIRRVVSVDVEKGKSRFELGLRKAWEFDYKKMGINGTTGLKEGQIHRAWFNWTYNEFLKIASRLSNASALRFLSSPSKFVMLRFSTQQLFLVLMKPAIMMAANFHLAKEAKMKDEKTSSSSGATSSTGSNQKDQFKLL